MYYYHNQNLELLKEYQQIVEFDSLLEKSSIKQLNKINVRELFVDMEDVEHQNFEYMYRQDEEDLEDDFSQPGFFGYGLFDDDSGKIQGYLYGYAISEDEYEEIVAVDMNSVRFYDKAFSKYVMEDELRQLYVKYKSFANFDEFSMFDKAKLMLKKNTLEKRIRKMFKPNNTLYVANLAINKPYRTGILKLLESFVSGLRQKGIKYIAFAGLTDTQRLFINSDGSLNTTRLNKINMKILASMTADDQLLTIAEL